MKKLVGLAVFTLFYTAILVGLCAFLFNRFCLGDYSGLRDNGSNWYEFGPGVITKSQCLSVVIILNPPERIVVRDKNKIEDVKKWLANNIKPLPNRFNFSPYRPDYSGHRPQTGVSITLCGSDNTIDLDSIIVTIPLTPLAMGLTQEQCEVKKAELEKLVGTN